MEGKTSSSQERIEVRGVDVALDAKKAELQEHDLGDVVLVSTNGIRRIPIPTNDPNDPLNFSTWRKIGAIATCCWFSLFAILSLSGMGTFMNTLFELYGAEHSATEIVGLSTYPTMVMTFGAFLLMPLSLVVGRRPIFLGSVIILLICTLIAGSAETFDAHLISRIFSGIATGSTESILPLIVTDLTFIDERTFYFGLYWSIQNCVNAGLLISLSYMVADWGWRSYYWFFSVVTGISFFLVILFVPETKYWRSPRAMNGEVIYTDEFGDSHVISDAEARDRFGILQQVTVVEETQKRSFLQEMKPWKDISHDGVQKLVGAYIKMGKACTSPAVIWTLMLDSISLGVGIGITLVYSTILSQEYQWSAKSVGLFNVGIIPACFVAMFYAGYYGDKMNVWLAKRNGGIHKSEHYLIHLIPAVIAGAIGLIAIAVCANKPQEYSPWGLVVGWAIYEFAFTCIMITSTAFAAEVIPESPGSAIVVIVGGKNLISFAASQGIVPMIAKYSYLTSFMILLATFVGIAALGIPVYFLNPKWRHFMSKKMN